MIFNGQVIIIYALIIDVGKIVLYGVPQRFNLTDSRNNKKDINVLIIFMILVKVLLLVELFFSSVFFTDHIYLRRQ